MTDMEFLSAGSAWPPDEVCGFLESYRAPLRLAVLGESGFPLVCSLWFAYENGRILCATTRQATIVEHLRANPKCGFELAPNEPPYFGVRGRGVAKVSSEGAMDLLGNLVDRYVGSRDTKFARWLLGRAEDEVMLAIDIHWLTSWDFRQRMSK
jgi:hypothetical protein